jgi:hypothetical protein
VVKKFNKAYQGYCVLPGCAGAKWPKKNPQNSKNSHLYCMCLSSHMVLMKRVPLHLEVIPFSQRNLGYIHIPLTTHRIIIYYSIRLKLLILAPLSSLSAPFPYPSQWILVPHNCFFMVGLHTTMLLLNNYEYLHVQRKLLSFNI